MLFKKKAPFAPNFLSGFPFSSPKTELETGTLFFFAFSCILVLFPFQYFQTLGIILLVLLLLAAVLIKIEWGVYALGIFAFFQGWEIAFSNYQIARNIIFLGSLNAPLVDFIGLILLPCSLFALAFKFARKNISWAHLKWPVVWYSAFLLVAAYSAKHTVVLTQSESFRYLLRPELFVFLVFVLLPHFFIQNELVLHRLLRQWFWIGCGIAVFGFSSLFVLHSSGWVRIQPYGIGSFAPLGVNHNLIAEVLIAIIPIGLWLMWKEKKDKNKKLDNRISRVYFLGTGLMTLVALGTLSRAAWVTLGVESITLFFLFRKQFQILWSRVKHLFAPFLFLSGVLIIYMIIFLTSNVVTSSDTSRLEVTKIVFFYLERSPIIGYGPGSFVPMIQDTYVHAVEFGDALDAHGFVQKILLEQGWLGFICFLSFLLSVLVILYKKQKHQEDVLPKLLFVMTLGAIVFQLFNTSYFNSVLWMPLGVALAAVGVGKKISVPTK